MPRTYLPRGVRTAEMAMDDLGRAAPAQPQLRPFITIAQQVGAECPSLPPRLAEALNATASRAPAWSHWDQELVERVSHVRGIPPGLVAALENSGHSWLDDLLTGLAGRTDEVVIFHGIRDAVRDLARGGRVILVGHGSVYMTRDLPGGLHVRLIAPLEHRVANTATRAGLSPHDARRHMRNLDRQRAAFFSRFWPDRPLVAEMFAAVLNVADLDAEQLARAIVAMLPVRDPA